MNWMKLVLIAVVMLVNLAIAPSSWADPGRFKNSPDYTEITQTIDTLVNDPENSGLTAAEIQQKITDLQFQKYILETAEERAQCTNLTGKTLGVYARSKKAPATAPATLYYLADSQVTSDNFDCEGILLPAGTQVATFGNTAGVELGEAIALKVVDGTQLIVSANPETGLVSLNVPALQQIKAGEADWDIPALTPEEIAAQTPNAPVGD